MNFISTRDIVVRSKNTGHAILFKKGVPTKVPDGMHEEVIEKGVLPADSDSKPTDPAPLLDATKPRIVLPPEDAGVRAKAIRAAMAEIVKRNVATEFTAGGTPSATAITAALGWKVDQKEARQLWDKYREELLRGPALSLA